jgi:hypothetical protein
MRDDDLFVVDPAQTRRNYDPTWPMWAKWIAQDESGAWFAYSIKPITQGRQWMFPNGSLVTDQKFAYLWDTPHHDINVA